MNAVLNSSTAMNAVANSKNTKTLKTKATITGRFIPIQAAWNDNDAQAYNGTWKMIGQTPWQWVKNNKSNAVATQLRANYDNGDIVYYDLGKQK